MVVRGHICRLRFVRLGAAPPLTRCSSTAIAQTKKKTFPVQQLGINMPTAVIMEENYDKLLEQCEAQELEVSVESLRIIVPTVISVLQAACLWRDV